MYFIYIIYSLYLFDTRASTQPNLAIKSHSKYHFLLYEEVFSSLCASHPLDCTFLQHLYNV